MTGSDSQPKQSADWQSQSRRKKHALRFARGLFLSVFVNPFALVVACVAIWFLAHLIRGMATTVAEVEHWTFEAVLGCGSCITALILVALLATSHFVTTVVLGAWRTDSQE